MLEHIHEQLKQIEIAHSVKVLYACESGSRAYGYPSKDSDYDVRFIYIHSPDWYLAIDDVRDTIELPHDHLLDMKGLDIRQALRMIRLSNPSLHEWINSEIEYHNTSRFAKTLFELIPNIFSPQASVKHYLNLGQHYYNEYLKEEEVLVKRYFSALRPILACQWIMQLHTHPPMVFQIMLNKLVKDMNVHQAVMDLITHKMRGHESDQIAQNELLNEFISSQLKAIEQQLASVEHRVIDPTAQLNQLFRDTLIEVFPGK